MIRVALLSLLAFSLAGPAAGISAPEVDTGDTPAGRYYVDNELCLLGGCVVSVWVYEESNGIGGLQRKDPQRDDTWGGVIASDTLVLAIFVPEP